MDAEIHRALQTLEDRGLLDNTLVFIVGDHGEAFNELGLFGHDSAFDRYQTKTLCVASIPGKAPRHVQRVTVALDMQTPGLVVLADHWDAGWHAYYDGKAVPILQTNHAVRGVVAPAGKGTLEFRYEPAGFAWGVRLCGLALAALTVWAGAIVWISRGSKPSVAAVAKS